MSNSKVAFAPALNKRQQVYLDNLSVRNTLRDRNVSISLSQLHSKTIQTHFDTVDKNHYRMLNYVFDPTKIHLETFFSLVFK